MGEPSTSALPNQSLCFSPTWECGTVYWTRANNGAILACDRRVFLSDALVGLQEGPLKALVELVYVVCLVIYFLFWEEITEDPIIYSTPSVTKRKLKMYLNLNVFIY
jgi:hypothetical protein